MSELNNKVETEKEINLLDLGKKFWLKRKFILKISAIGFVIGLIIAFSIPKEYTTEVILAPELNSSSGGGNMGALAAMAGINLGGTSGKDILSSPDLFPTILESTPFITGLFDIKVADQKLNIDTTLYEYLIQDQKFPWWSFIINLPSKVLSVFNGEEKNRKDATLNSFILTPEQMTIFSIIKSRLNINVDKKTGVIKLSSTMQSPLISAYVADTVTSYLQEYVIKYRTQKAREDLDFTEKLYNEAKTNYYDVQQTYAAYSDENLGVISARYGTAKERLQNEMSLSYSVYNQMAQQLQMAKVKIQDTTPVYTIIQPAVVPLVPVKPNKKIIVIGFAFLAFVGACGWIVGKEIFSQVL